MSKDDWVVGEFNDLDDHLWDVVWYTILLAAACALVAFGIMWWIS